MITMRRCNAQACSRSCRKLCYHVTFLDVQALLVFLTCISSIPGKSDQPMSFFDYGLWRSRTTILQTFKRPITMLEEKGLSEDGERPSLLLQLALRTLGTEGIINYPTCRGSMPR